MKIAILGMGTIGSGVYELAKNVSGISVKRTLDIRKWMDDMTLDIMDIVNDPEIEAVVETMGGIDPTFDYAMKCLNAGKHYVTANKHLVSEYIMELKEAAEKNGVCLMFSAACGGGIPILKNLYDAQNVDEIKAVGGILNGTTNYILDRMQTEGMDYQQALSEAQALGYAERDPASDVDGLDAQRKIILACAVAYAMAPVSKDIPTAGIRTISIDDIQYFKENGLCARLIASGYKTDGGVSASVEVHLFREDQAECAIHKNVNYAWYEGAASGRFSFAGQGAGKYPTAANVIQDLIRIQKGDGKMLPDSTKVIEARADREKAFYVRIPKGDYPVIEKIAVIKKELENDFIAQTIPVSTGDMHKMLKDIGGVFFAAIE